MESFQFIEMPDTEENLIMRRKGFEFISNIPVESIGQGIIFAYLLQSISLEEYKYGVQLLRSFKILQRPSQYKTLKNLLMSAENNSDLSQRLSNLFNPEILSEIKQLGQDLVDESSFLALQSSLKCLSISLNAHIVVVYNKELIEFAHFQMHRPVIIGICLDNKSDYYLYSTQQQVLEKSESKPEEIETLIKLSCSLLQKYNIPLGFGYELNRVLSTLSEDIQEEIRKLPKKTEVLSLSSAPILRNSDFSGLKIEKSKEVFYKLPQSLERTNNFLQEFIKNNPRKSNLLMAESENFEDSSIESSSSQSVSNLSQSRINEKCGICKQAGVLLIGNSHNCTLCQQCYFESFLKKKCLFCKAPYTESEQEILSAYFV